MGIFGKREAKLHNLDYVPSTGLGTNRTLPTKSGQPKHIEPKDCCTYDRKGQGGVAAYGHIYLD